MVTSVFTMILKATKVNIFMITCDSYPKHFAKHIWEGKLRIWSVVLYRRKHFDLKTYRWVLIHVSKFCYKQPILQLSCYWVLSSKNFYIVERSSIDCQEEASGEFWFNFESDWFRQWCMFSGPNSGRNKAKPKQTWTTLDAYSKIAPRCYSLDNYQITTIWSFSIRKLDNNFS